MEVGGMSVLGYLTVGLGVAKSPNENLKQRVKG